MSWEPTDLFEALDDAFSVISRDCRWIYANRAAERLSGKPRSELIGKSIFETFPDGEDTEFYAALRRAIATGESQNAESYYPPMDRWFGSQIYVIGDHLHMLTRDITEHKRAEARLLVLSRAAQVFARALELEPLCEAIACTLAELVGDACIVRIVDHDRLRPVAVHHPDPKRQELLREFFATPLDVREGLSAKVLASGEPLLIERVDSGQLRGSFTGEAHRAGIDRSPPHSVLAVPLTNGNERIGVLTLMRDRTPRAYNAADVTLLEDLADRASMAFTRAHLYEQAQQERRRAVALASASRAFSAAERDSHAILDLLARSAAAEVGEVAVANVISDDGKYFEPVAFHADSQLAAEVQSLLTARTPIAGSFSERIVATGRPLRVANLDVESFAASTDSKYADMVRQFKPRSFIMIPIKRGDRVLGVLCASRQHSLVPYSDAEERLLEELSDRAAVAIENGRALEAERLAREAAERIAEQTRRLQAIGSQLSHRRPPRDVAETILRESVAAFGGPSGAIWLLDDTRQRFTMLASVGYPAPELFATFHIDDDIPLVHAVRTETPQFLGTVKEYAAQFPRSAARLVGVNAPAEFSTACLPLVSEGRAIGGLAFAFPYAREFVADERTFLGVLASQCAQAIDRSQLLEQERAASAALAETNRTLNAVIHASPAAIIISDLDGVIRLWNPAAERIFGWTAAEIVGQRWPESASDQQAELAANLAQVARGEVVRGYETRRPRRDGTAIDVALWAAPVQRDEGETQALAVFVDITDRKAAEDAARTADRRKDEFLAMLGHELRNPLAPIMTALELMRVRNEQGGQRERDIIERQTRHLVRLVDDLLDLSRITRGKIELRKYRVDLGIAIAQAVEMASPLLEQRSHHVSIAAPRNLVYVDGDEFRLAQVFQNLLTNSAKYTPSGGSITVRLTTGDDHASVEIEDNGVGIAADVLPTIFDPFVQGAQKLDRSQGGLGIGLTLVRSLTELHGGHVDAHSGGPGRGSRFTVQLPLSLGTLRDTQRTGPGMAPIHGLKRRVLLVDDNRDAAEMLAELLRAAGHEVVVAFDGPSALGTLPAFTPDVALLDIGLPVMDGYDLARKLRDALPSAVPRLVAITGYGQEHDHLRSRQAGFDAHLVKPVQAAQVLAAVDETSS
ncbi:MAG TPA: GAF domain-containing protein [Kofleriaceae bacterium]